jgi:hypothetical protein
MATLLTVPSPVSTASAATSVDPTPSSAFSYPPSQTTAAVATASAPYCGTVVLHSKSYSLAEAAGVGIAVGVVAASIIILTFLFIRRRQTRARKTSPTISPNVLVTGPMDHNSSGWEHQSEEPKVVGMKGSGSGSLEHKEPPVYTKSSL